MAKRGKVLPARKRAPRDEESVLMRSAESLGRMIGSLQRQLDSASARLTRKVAAAADSSIPDVAPGRGRKRANGARGTPARKTARKTPRQSANDGNGSRRAPGRGRAAKAAKKR